MNNTIEVFSTNIRTKKQADKLLRRLKNRCPSYQINFDLEDCDNILRVESHNGQIDIRTVLKIVKNLGLTARVLPD
ncbi:methyltransferase type 11 [Galbibacter pacificus]|uniref:Methyltransferase type 11 n=1 Tax=Galbibacter pacificus TaxID=2996052 RepID=A0ABT6FQZ7_9FLAO|nr:methyltransferase type 11 [Galbibacter pacificus]MDG3581836.1 methyltransferase type 11 [Galbibacter pacificus]MDG3585690.1 methyltransferase type 11 [Galbibacter pacificus]